MDVPVTAPAATRKGSRSGLIWGIGGILAVLVLGAVGVGAAFMLGLIGGPKTVANNAQATPTPAATPVTAAADLVAIPGGAFKMGRDDGRPIEQPSHAVTVEPFKMDRTEVTNAEYFQFIKETGYSPVPAHWVNDKPIASEERMPVRFVNIDDISAFAAWRSKRDGVTYRLPTEAEWEFAARNGSKQNLFPWGDAFDAKCAVIEKENTEPEAVGSRSCPNDWGVVDLIGNVFEWTGSKAALYPGNKLGAMRDSKEPRYMIRGGAALNKVSGDFGISTTFRQDVPALTRDKELGFRLVSQ